MHSGKTRMSAVVSPLQVARPIVLDLLAAIAFAAAFFVAKRGFDVSGLHSVYIATVVGIGTGFAQLIHKKITHESIGPLQWLSLAVVLILGLMTIALHDEHYIKLKPSVIDLSVGIFMATKDWMTPYIPADVRQYLSKRLIFRAEKLWAVLMVGFAVVNVAVAFLADFAAWALYATFVPTLIIIALFFVQYSVFRRIATRTAEARHAGQAA
jgi:intracellular septation protein